MCGRDIDEPCVFREVLNDDALAVDPDRDNPRARRLHQQPGRRVAGLLHSHAVSRPQERADDDVNGLLGAAGDHDGIRIGFDPRETPTWRAIAARKPSWPTASP